MRLSKRTDRGYQNLTERIFKAHIKPLLDENQKEGSFNVLDVSFKDYHCVTEFGLEHAKEIVMDLIKRHVKLETKQPDNRKTLTMIIVVRAITHNFPYVGEDIAKKEISIYWNK